MAMSDMAAVSTSVRSQARVMVVVGAWRGRVVMVGLKKLAILCVDSEFGLWTHAID